jgi:glucose-6-phosphate 1-dehydrogenase
MVEMSLRSEAAVPAKYGRPADPCTIVIFGASGDLAKRLLVPALYNIACDGLLPENMALVGTARSDMDHESFRNQMSKDIRQFTTRDAFDERIWDECVRSLYYIPGNFEDPAAYQRLAQLLDEVDAKHQTRGNHLFYLAVPPVVFSMIARQLGEAGLARDDKGWSRLIVEKPFGNDLESAVALDRGFQQHWREDQIWRIDHYLGKETVQNLLTFRFGNGIFDPLWNRHHIDHVQLMVAEKIGIEGRGNYYERAGTLRDMVQNHMLQMLAYVAMEPPSSFRPNDIRNAKVEVLKAIRPLTPEEVLTNTVRGQYSGGTVDGNVVLGYREEPEVAQNSHTETFAAAKLFVDNWRWAGVPFYLRSGKRLPIRKTEVVIQFKGVPEVLFRDTPVERLEANQLLFQIQPDEGIELSFQAKVPGPILHLQTVRMHFEYKTAFEARRGTGYERLLYDCMVNDPTLFSRGDLVETSWKIAQPILDVWNSLPARDFPNYPAGTWGPRDAALLMERDGLEWRIP